MFLLYDIVLMKQAECVQSWKMYRLITTNNAAL